MTSTDCGLDSARAVLILEFINTEQFPGQICWNLPFLKGLVVTAGKPCRWLRFGMTAAHLFEHADDAITALPEERDALARVLAEMSATPPDLVVTTHALSAALQDVIREKLPDVRVVLVGIVCVGGTSNV